MKKIFLRLLSIGCLVSFMPAYAGIPNSSACNNFSFFVKNDTSSNMTVHYDIPGDGLPSWERSPSPHPVSGEVDVAQGETKKILTVINPIKDSQAENDPPFEGKVDSVHDDTWIHVQVFVKNSAGKTDLMYDKVIKKNVGKWKFYPLYAPYKKIPGQNMCTTGYQTENVFKVVPSPVEIDRSKTSFSLYDDVLLNNPPRYYDDRCIFADGECGVTTFADGKIATKKNGKTFVEKAGGDFTVSLASVGRPESGVFYVNSDDPKNKLNYTVLSSTGQTLNGTIKVADVKSLAELKDPLTVEDVQKILPDILNYLLTYDSWFKSMRTIDKIESGFAGGVTLQLKDKSS